MDKSACDIHDYLTLSLHNFSEKEASIAVSFIEPTIDYLVVLGALIKMYLMSEWCVERSRRLGLG